MWRLCRGRLIRSRSVSFCLETKRKDPKTGVRVVYSSSLRWMSQLTRVMRMVGALDSGDNAQNGWPLVEGAPAVEKFEANDGRHVTASECMAIVRAIRAASRKKSPAWESVCAFCDAEFGDSASEKVFAEFLRNLTEFARFNEKAAKLGGYTVS